MTIFRVVLAFVSCVFLSLDLRASAEVDYVLPDSKSKPVLTKDKDFRAKKVYYPRPEVSVDVYKNNEWVEIYKLGPFTFDEILSINIFWMEEKTEFNTAKTLVLGEGTQSLSCLIASMTNDGVYRIFRKDKPNILRHEKYNNEKGEWEYRMSYEGANFNGFAIFYDEGHISCLFNRELVDCTLTETMRIFEN